MSALLRLLRGVRWYARALAGETRWDEYLAHCTEHGHEPVSRREFERTRADAAAARPQSRCC
ncbi:hypothetical protein NUM3379_38110 [Kineococcus sp. NUM-3379]